MWLKVLLSWVVVSDYRCFQPVLLQAQDVLLDICSGVGCHGLDKYLGKQHNRTALCVNVVWIQEELCLF